MNSTQEKKAFLIAIPVASVLSACSFVLFGMLGRDRFISQTDWLDIAKVVISYSLFMLPFVAVGGVIVGLPAAMTLRRFHVTNLVAWLLVGSFAGGAVSFAILGSLAIKLTTEVVTWATAIGVIPGLIAALLWWWIAERHQLPGSSHA
ncbi:hypothetical protein [Tsuneonella sp. SYSU-LHT278]|uniref:hypothetical protein n=1 Tax=Tsuneonella sediminis TaxID=3416089 RepID=UPI003F7A4C13